MLIQIDWMWNWNKTGVWHGAGWVLLSNCHLMQHGPQLELDNFLMCGTMWLSNVSNELAMLLQCLQDLPRSWMQTLEAIAAPHTEFEKRYEIMRMYESCSGSVVNWSVVRDGSEPTMSHHVTALSQRPRLNNWTPRRCPTISACGLLLCQPSHSPCRSDDDHAWSCGMREIFLADLAL